METKGAAPKTTKPGDAPKLAALSFVERRKCERLRLRLPVRFKNDSAQTNACFTENISSEGFYCVSPEPFVPGDRLEVEFVLPAHNPGQRKRQVRLNCHGLVVRIDATWIGPGFGIGCRIESYSVQLEEVEC